MRGRRLLITLTLDEGTRDMMLGDELNDDFHDVRRHWHGLDKIATGIGERLSFRRISVTARISAGRSDATGRTAIYNAGVPDARLSR